MVYPEVTINIVNVIVIELICMVWVILATGITKSNLLEHKRISFKLWSFFEYSRVAMLVFFVGYYGLFISMLGCAIIQEVISIWATG